MTIRFYLLPLSSTTFGREQFKGKRITERFQLSNSNFTFQLFVRNEHTQKSRLFEFHPLRFFCLTWTFKSRSIGFSTKGLSRLNYCENNSHLNNDIITQLKAARVILAGYSYKSISIQIWYENKMAILHLSGCRIEKVGISFACKNVWAHSVWMVILEFVDIPSNFECFASNRCSFHKSIQLISINLIKLDSLSLWRRHVALK